MTITPEAVAEHCRTLIAQAEVAEEPYPHIRVENILPEPFYESLLSVLPPFETFDIDGLTTGNLWYPMLRERCASQSWIAECYDAAMNAIAGALLRRYGHRVEQYVRSLWPSCDEPLRYVDPEAPLAFQAPGIVERLRDFRQPPHLDGAFRVLSAFLYLPERSLPGMGTEMWKVTRFGERHSPLKAMITRSPDEVELEPVPPGDFSRNTLFSFLNSQRSYHGIPFLDPAVIGDVRRVGVNMFVHVNQETVETLIGRGLDDFAAAIRAETARGTDRETA